MSHEQISHSTPLVEQVDSTRIESIEIEQSEITKTAGSLILEQTIRLDLAPEHPEEPTDPPAVETLSQAYERQVNQPEADQSDIDQPTNPVGADTSDLDPEYARWVAQREEDNNPETNWVYLGPKEPVSEEVYNQLLNYQFSEIGFMLDSYLDQYEEPDETARNEWFEMKRIVAEGKAMTDSNGSYTKSHVLTELIYEARDFANQHHVDGPWYFVDPSPSSHP
jgi:hypothetical protein